MIWATNRFPLGREGDRSAFNRWLACTFRRETIRAGRHRRLGLGATRETDWQCVETKPSRTLDGHVICVRRQRAEIRRIARQHRSTTFRECYDQRVDSRAAASTTSQERGSSRESLRDLINDVAHLEETVRVCVAARISLETLHQYYGRNQWRPEPDIPERLDQRH